MCGMPEADPMRSLLRGLDAETIMRTPPKPIEPFKWGEANMSTGRVLWILWCLGWAAVWFFAGFSEYQTPSNTLACLWNNQQCTQPTALAGGIIAAVISLICMRIPVGKHAKSGDDSDA